MLQFAPLRQREALTRIHYTCTAVFAQVSLAVGACSRVLGQCKGLAALVAVCVGAPHQSRPHTLLSVVKHNNLGQNFLQTALNACSLSYVNILHQNQCQNVNILFIT